MATIMFWLTYYLTIYVSTYLSTNERRPLVQVQRSGLLPGQETSSQHQRAEAERIKWVTAAIINCRVSQNTAPTPYNVYSSSFMCLQFTESNGNVFPYAVRAVSKLYVKIKDWRLYSQADTLLGSKNPSVIHIRMKVLLFFQLNLKWCVFHNNYIWDLSFVDLYVCVHTRIIVTFM